MNQETDILSKVIEAKRIVWRHLCTARRPVVMWSGGADSMVLLWLVRQYSHDIPVFLFRENFQPAKFAHTEKIAREWELDVHTVTPADVDLVGKGSFLEILNVVKVAPAAVFYLPTGLNAEEPARADWACGCEVINKPTSERVEWRWDVAFLGHRGDDVDPVHGPIPLPGETAQLGPVKLVYPFLNWTRADIWAASERFKIPQNLDRYDPADGYRERADRSANPDYMNICVECLKRDGSARVICPKTGGTVPRIGNSIDPEARAAKWRDRFVNVA